MSEDLFAGFLSGTVQTVVGHPFDTLKIWKQQNIRPKLNNIFRGISYPLVTGTFVTGGQFASYNWMNKLTDSSFMSGAFSGIFSGLCIAPIDKYKIAAQTNGFQSKYGVLSCMLREIPAGAIYFGSYSNLRDNNIQILPAGAISGASSWLLTYPFDIIKTQVQSGEYTLKNAILNIVQHKTHITKGLGFCLSRAILVNSIGFYVYENN